MRSWRQIRALQLLESLRPRTEAVGVWHSPNPFLASSSATAICGRKAQTRADEEVKDRPCAHHSRDDTRGRRARGDSAARSRTHHLPIPSSPSKSRQQSNDGLSSMTSGPGGVDRSQSFHLAGSGSAAVKAGRFSKRRLRAAAFRSVRGNPHQIHCRYPSQTRQRCSDEANRPLARLRGGKPQSRLAGRHCESITHLFTVIKP